MTTQTVRCTECKCLNDHTWWCSIGADENPRAYYWQEGRLEDMRAAHAANEARRRA